MTLRFREDKKRGMKVGAWLSAFFFFHPASSIRRVSDFFFFLVYLNVSSRLVQIIPILSVDECLNKVEIIGEVGVAKVSCTNNPSSGPR